MYSKITNKEKTNLDLDEIQIYRFCFSFVWSSERMSLPPLIPHIAKFCFFWKKDSQNWLIHLGLILTHFDIFLHFVPPPPAGKVIAEQRELLVFSSSIVCKSWLDFFFCFNFDQRREKLFLKGHEVIVCHFFSLNTARPEKMEIFFLKTNKQMSFLSN